MAQNLPTSLPLLQVSGAINGNPARFMIDSGSTGDFINERFVIRNHEKTTKLPASKPLKLATGTQVKVQNYLHNAKIYIASDKRPYHDTLSLHILPGPPNQWDVILGMPWLARQNPKIDWSERILQLTHKDQCKIITEYESPPEIGKKG
jgi:hypothetical protein